MNTFSYFSIFCLAFIFSGKPNLNNGLIAHYSFNNCQPHDLTDGGSNGEVYGQPSCVCGVEGNALFFDGINDYVEFAGQVNNVFNTTDFTVSFYFKPNKYSVFSQSMLSKREWCQDSIMFDINLNATQRKIQTDLYESSFKFFKNISPDLPDTDWVHFTLVRKGTWAYTYINGEPRREARKCSGVDIGNKALLSFANSPCINNGRMVRFKGSLDELRIYDRALSDEEVEEIYKLNPIELAEADCVTYLEENAETEYICGN